MSKIFRPQKIANGPVFDYYKLYLLKFSNYFKNFKLRIKKAR